MATFEILALLVSQRGNVKRKRDDKSSKSDIISYVIKHFKLGTPFNEITEIVNGITLQPILVCFDNNQIFLKLDSKYCELPSGNFLYAIDLLFKSFYVFNVDYPSQASYFYYFIENIFEMRNNQKPFLLELDTKILM